MKIRHTTSSGDDKIELQMTPMIDIVFQLLVFFIMTFRIVAQEGDFNIKMPSIASTGIPEESEVLPMRLVLRANENGDLVSITMENRQFESFAELNNFVISKVGDDTGPSDAGEVELDCDYDLKYEHVIDAISAVSGYRDQATGLIYPLIEKVKFAPIDSSE